MNRFIALLVMLLLAGGCYRTAPTDWQYDAKGDVINWRHDVPNGSRLNVDTRVEGESLVVSTIEIPLCREVEEGSVVTREVAKDEVHIWPFGIVALGAATAGGYVFLEHIDAVVDGESSDEDAVYVAVGGPVAVIGTILGVGAVAGAEYGIEPEIQYRQHLTPLKRWANKNRRDCTDAQARFAPNVHLDVEISFEKWHDTVKPYAVSDASGLIRFPIAGDIARTAAHCGRATINLRGRNWKPDRQSRLNDEPSNPLQYRDEWREFSFKIYAPRKADPGEIRDQRFAKIASGCIYRNEEECLGRDREYKINWGCKHQCTEELGAYICSAQYEIDVSLPGMSVEERWLAEERYDACVKTEGITEDQTRDCFESCVRTEREKVCPRGW